MRNNTIFQDYLTVLYHSKCGRCNGQGRSKDLLVPYLKKVMVRCISCSGTGFYAPITFIAEQLDQIRIKQGFLNE